MRIELNTEYRLSPKVKIIWMLNTILTVGLLFIVFIIIGITNKFLLGPLPIIIDSLLLLSFFLIIIYFIFHYIYIEMKWKNFKYKFTENNLILEYGIIRKRIERIPYIKIQNLAIRYGIIHRLLGVGQVIISTAATDIKLSEFSLDAIEDPQSFVDEAILRIEGVSKEHKKRVLAD